MEYSLDPSTRFITAAAYGEFFENLRIPVRIEEVMRIIEETRRPHIIIPRKKRRDVWVYAQDLLDDRLEEMIGVRRWSTADSLPLLEGSTSNPGDLVERIHSFQEPLSAQEVQERRSVTARMIHDLLSEQGYDVDVEMIRKRLKDCGTRATRKGHYIADEAMRHFLGVEILWEDMTPVLVSYSPVTHWHALRSKLRAKLGVEGLKQIEIERFETTWDDFAYRPLQTYSQLFRRKQYVSQEEVEELLNA